jgi:hypothetical protein
VIPVIPSPIAVIMTAAELAIAVAIWGVLSASARRSDLPEEAQRRVRVGAAWFLGVWLAAALYFAPDPASVRLSDPFRITPLIPLLDTASIAGALFAIWRSPSLRRALSAVPLAALHALQAWRVLGVVFVVLLAQGQLPAHFALPAGWGDVFVGLTAPFVALALARGARGAAMIALSWNALGLLDLAVAVGMGTGLLAPLLVPELGPRVPPVPAMGVYPLVLVPAFAVPASALVHVLALSRLAREARPQPGLQPEEAR